MSAPRASKPRPAGRRPPADSSEPAPRDRDDRQGAFVERAEPPCVWMSAGLLAYKLCTRGLDCEHCPLDAALGGESAQAQHTVPLLEVPADRCYSRAHAWVQRIDRTRVRCGVDALASLLLRRVSAVVLPAVGGELQRGAPACWLVDDCEPIASPAPLAGVVTRTNDATRATPRLVADHPLDDGWLFELDLDERALDVHDLLDAPAMRRRTARDLRWLRGHARRAAEQARARVGATAQDGGRPLRAPRDVLGAARYHQLVRRLLR